MRHPQLVLRLCLVTEQYLIFKPRYVLLALLEIGEIIPVGFLGSIEDLQSDLADLLAVGLRLFVLQLELFDGDALILP